MKVYVIAWRWQAGRALTLPIPGLGVCIFVQSRLDWERDGKLRRHELAHAEQIARWGAWQYLWRHFWARVQWLNLFAWQDEVEAEAYRAEALSDFGTETSGLVMPPRFGTTGDHDDGD